MIMTDDGIMQMRPHEWAPGRSKLVVTYCWNPVASTSCSWACANL